MSKRKMLRAERRRQILEAALAVFAEKGFNAANVSDVAARAGVSQGTIYWYFESKEELLTQALLSFMNALGQGVSGTLEQHTTAEDKLRALGQAMVVFSRDATGLFALFREFWASSSRRAEAGELWNSVLVEFKDLVVGIITQGMASGEFQAVDAESLVWAMVAAYDGLAAYLMLMPDMDLARVSQSFMETLIKGLQAGNGSDA